LSRPQVKCPNEKVRFLKERALQESEMAKNGNGQKKGGEFYKELRNDKRLFTQGMVENPLWPSYSDPMGAL